MVACNPYIILYHTCMTTKKTFRITLRPKETEDLEFLMAHFKKDTPHDMIRFILTEKANSVREVIMRYGPKGGGSGSGSRENKETRLNALLALDIPELNAELERLHVFEQLKSRSDMRLWIEDDGIGGRIVKFHSPSGGDSGQMNFGDIITEIRKII